MCIQSLRDEGYEVTGYFANPNIHPVTEYFRRREAMEQVAEQMSLPMIWQDDVYDLPGWLKAVHDFGIADNQDHARCGYCYESRLALTCAVASEHGFDCFTTSLLYSKHQQHDAIRRIGERVAACGDYRSDAGFGSAFLYRDFRPSGRPGSTGPRKWASTGRTTAPVFSASTSGLRRSSGSWGKREDWRGRGKRSEERFPRPLQTTPTPFQDFRMGRWRAEVFRQPVSEAYVSRLRGEKAGKRCFLSDWSSGEGSTKASLFLLHEKRESA